MFNSSGIEINKSSLVSLKAEILRKQQEINITKLQDRPPPTKVFKNKKKSSKPEETKDKDSDDEEILAKSKQMLESKAILYNSLSKRASNPTEQDKEITKRLLVQFDKKDRELDIQEEQYDSDREYNSDNYEEPDNPDEQWVEYTDILGRTRKCLRKDLEQMKKQDKELRENVKDSEREGLVKKEFVKDSGEEIETKVENAQENLSAKNELLSSDMRRELMRQEWEKQEEELLKKKDIHYQDILFNEARYHGAAYYGFSRNEEERLKQQEELNKLRAETAKQQETISEMKKIREKQMAARLKAARNRKRARMGLPPEPDEPETETPEELESPIDLEKQHLQQQKEAEEKQKQIERSKMVRPWDIGKEIMKTHYEYSQEEWVNKQREERPQEFAPPSSYSHRNFNSKRPKVEDSNEDVDRRLYFTTKKPNSYGLNDRKQSSSSYDPSVIEDSVTAGLRYLREQTEKQQWPNS